MTNKKVLPIILATSTLLFALMLIYQLWQKSNQKQLINENLQKLPSFVFYKTDNNKFTNNSLSINKAVMILYFNSDCGFCRIQLKNLKTKIGLLKNFEILLISSESAEILKGVSEKYELNGIENVHFLSDKENQFYQKFGTNQTQSAFIYNQNHELMHSIKGDFKFESIPEITK